MICIWQMQYTFVCTILHAGVELNDPWGEKRQVLVRLFSYVVDNPEVADVWCTKQGSTQRPCEICFAPQGSLLETDFSYLLRTEEQCKALLQRYHDQTTIKAKRELTAEYSFHPVPSGLWDFAGGETEDCSASWAFTSDTLHNEDLGVFLYIIRVIPVRFVLNSYV